MRAIIEMDGGLIKNIVCEEPLEVLVIDRDREDDEGEEIGEKMSRQGRMIDADEDELTVETLFNQAWEGEENGNA